MSVDESVYHRNFQEVDRDGKGGITRDELKVFLRKRYKNLSEAELKERVEVS